MMATMKISTQLYLRETRTYLRFHLQNPKKKKKKTLLLLRNAISNMMSEEEKEIALDILIELLERLPIKSLLKFMSVSKQWKSVIQSSRFIADYNRSSHIQPPNRLFVGYDSENHVDIFNDDGNGFLQPLTIPMPASLLDLNFTRLIGYSQGLFGFWCANRKDFSYVVVIWNPSIRKSVRIPLPEDRTLYEFGLTVCNATDPTIFGITNKHNSAVRWQKQVEIYSLSTRDWRTLCSDAPRESLDLNTMRVVIDGFIHWIAYDFTTKGDLLYKLVVSFDLTREKFTELCLPPSLAAPTSRARLELSKLRESLVVLESYENEPEVGVWMMMMEPAGGVQNSFTKLFTIKDLVAIRWLYVVGFTKYGQPIIQKGAGTDWWDFLPSEWKLFFYEPHSRCFKDTGIPGKRNARLAGSYMETLLLLDHRDDEF